MLWMMIGANGYALNGSGRPSGTAGDGAGQRFDAVVVDGERVLAVGTAGELRLQFGARVDRVLDVCGATVIPGLVDSHLHVSMLGERSMRLDLTGVASKAETLARIRAWAQSLAPDAWVVGGGWDDNRFAGGGDVPTLAELDEAAGGRPLLLTRVCRHAHHRDAKVLYTIDGGEVAYAADGRAEGWA